jgi:hypothetical protein
MSDERSSAAQVHPGSSISDKFKLTPSWMAFLARPWPARFVPVHAWSRLLSLAAFAGLQTTWGSGANSLDLRSACRNGSWTENTPSRLEEQVALVQDTA